MPKDGCLKLVFDSGEFVLLSSYCTLISGATPDYDSITNKFECSATATDLILRGFTADVAAGTTLYIRVLASAPLTASPIDTGVYVVYNDYACATQEIENDIDSSVTTTATDAVDGVTGGYFGVQYQVDATVLEN